MSVLLDEDYFRRLDLVLRDAEVLGAYQARTGLVVAEEHKSALREKMVAFLSDMRMALADGVSDSLPKNRFFSLATIAASIGRALMNPLLSANAAHQDGEAREAMESLDEQVSAIRMGIAQYHGMERPEMSPAQAARALKEHFERGDDSPKADRPRN